MTNNMKMVVEKLRTLGRPAGTAEIHNGSSHHVSTTRNAILALEEARVLKRVGTGKATKYRLGNAARAFGNAKVGNTAPANVQAAGRWVILVDGEALIVNATCVQVYPERRP